MLPTRFAKCGMAMEIESGLDDGVLRQASWTPFRPLLPQALLLAAWIAIPLCVGDG
jgi:hypothetical protein